ncbi:MAG: hypothetical protein A2032_05070 [Chloroflexi bacterium RBG_19FT_COMBO_49_13]|nr:MAG: hypothetical protein A2Y53_04045 [Chloroflexi bacterium RBG_16_47_49]OGO62192.1 MAG: hypothetical protein A2032_05070 [Chloroflexi bacterium RBG_19FT_COMBO_49_13]
MEKQVSHQSALIYLTVSVGVALVFLLAASVFGSYPLVAKIGGTVWVGLLSLIVSMPLITSSVKRKFKNQGMS